MPSVHLKRSAGVDVPPPPLDASLAVAGSGKGKADTVVEPTVLPKVEPSLAPTETGLLAKLVEKLDKLTDAVSELSARGVGGGGAGTASAVSLSGLTEEQRREKLAKAELVNAGLAGNDEVGKRQQANKGAVGAQLLGALRVEGMGLSSGKVRAQKTPEELAAVQERAKQGRLEKERARAEKGQDVAIMEAVGAEYLREVGDRKLDKDKVTAEERQEIMKGVGTAIDTALSSKGDLETPAEERRQPLMAAVRQAFKNEAEMRGLKEGEITAEQRTEIVGSIKERFAAATKLASEMGVSKAEEAVRATGTAAVSLKPKAAEATVAR
jgi:hypothetical protein